MMWKENKKIIDEYFYSSRILSNSAIYLEFFQFLLFENNFNIFFYEKGKKICPSLVESILIRGRKGQQIEHKIKGSGEWGNGIMPVTAAV